MVMTFHSYPTFTPTHTHTNTEDAYWITWYDMLWSDLSIILYYELGASYNCTLFCHNTNNKTSPTPTPRNTLSLSHTHIHLHNQLSLTTIKNSTKWNQKIRWRVIGGNVKWFMTNQNKRKQKIIGISVSLSHCHNLKSRELLLTHSPEIGFTWLDQTWFVCVQVVVRSVRDALAYVSFSSSPSTLAWLIDANAKKDEESVESEINNSKK